MDGWVNKVALSPVWASSTLFYKCQIVSCWYFVLACKTIQKERWNQPTNSDSHFALLCSHEAQNWNVGNYHWGFLSSHLLYHADPNVVTVLSYLTVSCQWSSFVSTQHSGCAINQSGRVSKAWKKRNVQLGFISVFLQLSVLQCWQHLGYVWPASPSRQPIQQPVFCPNIHPGCLSGTLRAWRNKCPFSFITVTF